MTTPHDTHTLREHWNQLLDEIDAYCATHSSKPFRERGERLLTDLEAAAREEGYAEGYKQGSFDKEADLELGVVRGQAVAEFAREVVPRINALQRTDEFQMSHDHTYDEALEDALAAIRTLAKERGIDLNTLKS